MNDWRKHAPQTMATLKSNSIPIEVPISFRHISEIAKEIRAPKEELQLLVERVAAAIYKDLRETGHDVKSIKVTLDAE